MKFADILDTSERVKRKLLKVAHDEQLDKALYVWFIQQRTSGTPISGPQMICNSVVSQLNVVFLIQSVLFFINIHIFDYPDPRLSGLLCLVPTSPDNRGSTVHTSRLREVKKVFRKCHLHHA